VAEAARLAAEGVKELILVAQDTSSFGPEGRRQGALLQLLERLEGIDAVKWIRLLYAHPAHLREDVLRRMASSSKICSYLDLPIQHINDRLLARMGRPLSRSRLEALLDQVRELIPGISLRTALMVGFPGEGEEEFQELVEFVRWQRFDHLGVFAYSREKGTPSARLRGRVAAAVAARRRDKLLRMQKSISRARLRRYREKSLEVIIDGPFPDRGSELMVARGRFQSPEVDGVVVVEGGGLAPGDLVKVTIKESSAYDLYGVADR
jgi:ribosomal protein S12 methylthiotransferase